MVSATAAVETNVTPLQEHSDTYTAIGKRVIENKSETSACGSPCPAC